MNRAEVERPDHSRTIESAQMAPHVADFGDGDRLITSAAGMHIAIVEAHLDLSMIAIVLLHENSMAGTSLAVTVESARQFADTLNRLADDLEAEAGELAAAALRKAAGK